MDEDPYHTLQVSPDAGPDEIRAAYRRLALRHHPDRMRGSAERMVAINRAYALLGNPERRRRYDATRQPAVPIEPPPSDSSTRQRIGEEPPFLWALDLDTHYEDWKQMFEEERQRWEALLRARGPADPGREAVEQELQRTRQAQLDLENAWRARGNRPPLSLEAFERARAQEQEIIARHTPSGCLSLLAVLAALVTGTAHAAHGNLGG